MFKAVALPFLVFRAHPREDEFARDAAMTPPLPSWAEYFTALPPLGRRITVACPCVGIHGCGQSLLSMGLGADTFNCYDLQPAYYNYLHRHLRELGQGVDSIAAELHLGKEAGDLLRVAIPALTKPIDFVVSGPPCPPWSAIGTRRSLGDRRGKVFVRVLQWCVY